MIPVFLSVVIPVYKVEKYLEECVESVLSQDFYNIEVILVDDGSPDRSSEICDDFALKDNRVRVIHQKNSGLSSARNTGIRKAKGKYITFLDSDDKWSNRDSLKRILSVFEEISPDLLMFDGFDFFDGSDENLSRRDASAFSSTINSFPTFVEQYEFMVSEGNIHESAYTKILKYDYLVRNNLFFKTGITGEDTEWIFRIYRNNPKFYYIDEKLYRYRSGRKGSITNSVGLKTIEDILSIIKQSISFFRQTYSEGIDKIKKIELGHCATLWSIALSMIPNISKEDRRKVYSSIKELSWVMDYRTSQKAKSVFWLYKILGLKLTSKILNVYSTYIRKRINYIRMESEE